MSSPQFWRAWWRMQELIGTEGLVSVLKTPQEVLPAEQCPKEGVWRFPPGLEGTGMTQKWTLCAATRTVPAWPGLTEKSFTRSWAPWQTMSPSWATTAWTGAAWMSMVSIHEDKKDLGISWRSFLITGAWALMNPLVCHFFSSLTQWQNQSYRILPCWQHFHSFNQSNSWRISLSQCLI